MLSTFVRFVQRQFRTEPTIPLYRDDVEWEQAPLFRTMGSNRGPQRSSIKAVVRAVVAALVMLAGIAWLGVFHPHTPIVAGRVVGGSGRRVASFRHRLPPVEGGQTSRPFRRRRRAIATFRQKSPLTSLADSLSQENLLLPKESIWSQASAMKDPVDSKRWRVFAFGGEVFETSRASHGVCKDFARAQCRFLPCRGTRWGAGCIRGCARTRRQSERVPREEVGRSWVLSSVVQIHLVVR